MAATARIAHVRRQSRPNAFLPRGMSPSNAQLWCEAARSLNTFYFASETLRYDAGAPVVVFDADRFLESLAREDLKDTLARLHRLSTWKEGWNGYDAAAPESDAIARADDWLVRLYLTAAQSGRPWITPNISASADGEVVFEWWYGGRKLTIYVSGETVEFVRVWGPDMDTQMADGDAESPVAMRSLWVWLTSH